VSKVLLCANAITWEYNMRRLFLRVIVLSLLPRLAYSGTVITTNLPAGTAIVNINAQQDGAASYDGGQDNWFDPFFSGGATSLLQYSVQPGTYTFCLTNPTLASSQFPALTAGQLSQMFTAWTYNSPWITDYFVFDAAGAAATNLRQIFAGAIRPAPRISGEASAAAAFNHAVANHYDDNVTKQPGGRNTGVRVTSYTFATAETLTFAIPDNVLSDNNGGLSVVVTRLAGVAGDYNNNGIVDGADYVLWRKNINQSTLPNRSTGISGPVGSADYDFWRSRFGATSGLGSGNSSTNVAAVPEPATLVILILATSGCCLRRGRTS
jgi:hypothetical protein